MHMQFLHAWKYWWFYTKLIKEKQRAHDLVIADLCFLDSTKGVQKYDKKIAKMREELKAEQIKENKDQSKINDIAYDIAEAEELLKKYNRMTDVAKELVEYVKIIKKWRKDVWKKIVIGQ